jgi:hypothetical protein
LLLLASLTVLAFFLADDPAALQWKKKNQDIKAANVASQIAALSANTANILMLQSG